MLRKRERYEQFYKQAGKAMPETGSRGLRLGGMIGGGALLILVLAILMLHTPPARKYAAKQAAAILRRQGIDFEASSLNYNLLDLSASLRSVVVRSPQAPDLPPLLTAAEVNLDLSLRKLIQGKYHLEDASVAKPNLHVVIDERGRDNIPRPPKSSSGETDFFVNHFLLSGGTFQFEDRRQRMALQVPIERGEVDGNPLTGNHAIRLRTMAGGSARLEQRTFSLGTMSADLEVENDAVNLRNVALAIADSQLTLSGRVDKFQDPRFDLKANSAIALESLLRSGGVPQQASGTVNVAWTINGPLAQLKATARADGKGLTLDRFRNVDLKAEAAYDAAASRVRVDSFNANSNLGAVRGKADVALTQQAGTSTANFSASRVDVGAAMTALGQPVRVASVANGQIAAKWPGLDFARAGADATVRLNETRSVPVKNVLPVSGSLNAKTQGSRTVVGVSEIRALGTTVNGQVSLDGRERLGGQLRASSHNAGTTVSQVEAFLGRDAGTLLGTPVAGKVDVAATLGGTVRQPSAKAVIDAPSLQAGTLAGISVRAEGSYDPAIVKLDRLSASWQSQTVSASGAIGLRGKEQSLNLQAQADQVSIAQVLAGLNRSQIDVDGTASFRANVTGTVQHPEAQFQMTGSNLTAYREALGAMTLRGGVSGRVARVDELNLEKPQDSGAGLLHVSGTYDLDTRAYALDLSAKGVDLTQLTLPDSSAVHAKAITVEAKGQGSVDDPALKLTVSADTVMFRNQEVGRIEATADVAARQAEVRAAVPKYSLTGAARVGTQAPYAGTFEWKARNTQLQSLPLPPNVEVAGTVTATVTGSGTLEDYTRGEATAQVDAADLQWQGQPLRTDGPLRAKYSGEVLTIEQATVVARDSRASMQGTLPLTEAAGTGEVKLTAKLDLATLPSYIPVQQPVTAAGTATIDGTIRGTLRRIDPELKVALQGGRFSTPQMNAAITNAELQGDVRNGALELQSAAAMVGPASLTASGVIPFGLLPELPMDLPRRQGAAEFRADLKSLELSTLGVLPEGVGGTISASLQASAPRADLDSLTATLTLPELKLSVRNYAVEQATPSRVIVRNSVANVEEFRLKGPLTDLRLSGTVGLTGDRPLNLQLNGTADASLASALSEQMSANGAVTLQTAVTGTAREPSVTGFVELADGHVAMKSPLVAADALDARLELKGKQFVLTKLDGSLNGGTLSGSGMIGYEGGRLANTNLTVKADDVYFNFPEGLKTVSNVELQLQSTASGPVLGGQVVIQEGGFADDLNLDRGILAAVTAPSSIDLTEERDPLLESLRLNIGVRTATPLVVENNLARAEVSADLRVVGTPYEVGLAGRMEIEEEGEIRLQERQYLVERGIITFNNERRIEPELNVAATTTVSGYDIRLQIQGPPGKTETILTSDPSLPEPDILAMLITGKTMDEMQGQEFAVAREQVLSYLAGRVGTTLGRGIQSATGLSTVRLEPNLIASETDPSARLTVGQDITRNLELVYSMDLVDSSDQIYVAEYDLTKRFTTRGVRQSDGSFRMDFRHDLRFGGVPEPRRDTKRLQRRIGEVQLSGNPFFPETTILDRLKLKPGSKYDFFKTRKGVDRVTKLYLTEGLLEAKVRMRREARNGTVDLRLNLESGPKVDFVFEGITIPRDVRKRVQEVWHTGVFDTQRAEEARGAILDWLAREKYLRPVIEYSISTEGKESKRVLFDIDSGVRYQNVTVEFEGAAGEQPSELRSVINKQNLEIEVYTKPARVTELLTRYYHEVGYLDAAVSAPRYELEASSRTGRVVFPVKEGPLYRVGSVRFEGNKAISAERLAEAAPMPAGEVYKPVLRENALGRLKAVYWQEGYNDIETRFLTERSATEGVVNVTFSIVEGPRGVVREILVEGNDKTSEGMIRTQLALGPGEPLSLEKVGESRRHLYDTGAYSLVDIVNEPIDNGTVTTGDKPVRLRVRVREIQPYQLHYGAFYDTEHGPGVIFDLENRNSLGSARVLGFRGRYDSQLREARVYFSQPVLRRFPLKTIVSPFWRQERNPATEDTDPFNVNRIGVSVQQEARLRKNFLLNYGYRIEKSRTYDPGPDAFFDVPLRIASLTTSLSRETRDEILDATRGSFMSHAVQFSPMKLGSELSFLKYFGQYFRYIPLQKPRIELFTNEVHRPRLVYAGGVRVGLARGFGGQEVPLSERFFAGGATTIRGFEQNTVGPIAGRQPLGGQGMLVINNEIRAPLFSIFDGVGFVDIGNVYEKVSDFSFTDVRKTAGVGLRARTPWFLLRLDYGFKLDRRQGESSGRLFFSIGQAF